MNAGRWQRLAVRVLGTLALVLACLVARVLAGAASEYSMAEGLLAKGHDLDAVTHYRRALGWYVPGSPYGSRAIARLRDLSRRAEAKGEFGRAIFAERAIHAGIESARSAFSPYYDELARSDARVTSLRARIPSAKPLGSARSPADPNAFFSLLASLGWLGFVAFSFALVLRGVDADGRLSHKARRDATLLCACLLLFVLGLSLA
jgi:hypothetical protein